MGMTRRRAVLRAALLLPLAGCGRRADEPAPRPVPASVTPDGPAVAARFAELERRFDARLGLHAVHTGSGQELAHRADERFAMTSTFKVLAAAAVLDRTGPEHLDVRVRYRDTALVPYSPITEQHVGDGLTIRELCDAAIRYSDNTAGNLLLDDLGGPDEVTAFVRSLDDGITRLDRREPDLNSSTPATSGTPPRPGPSPPTTASSCSACGLTAPTARCWSAGSSATPPVLIAFARGCQRAGGSAKDRHGQLRRRQRCGDRLAALRRADGALGAVGARGPRCGRRQRARSPGCGGDGRRAGRVAAPGSGATGAGSELARRPDWRDSWEWRNDTGHRSTTSPWTSPGASPPPGS